jgi:hypothetical protein
MICLAQINIKLDVVDRAIVPINTIVRKRYQSYHVIRRLIEMTWKCCYQTLQNL